MSLPGTRTLTSFHHSGVVHCASRNALDFSLRYVWFKPQQDMHSHKSVHDSPVRW